MLRIVITCTDPSYSSGQQLTEADLSPDNLQNTARYLIRGVIESAERNGGRVFPDGLWFTPSFPNRSLKRSFQIRLVENETVSLHDMVAPLGARFELPMGTPIAPRVVSFIFEFNKSTEEEIRKKILHQSTDLLENLERVYCVRPIADNTEIELDTKDIIDFVKMSRGLIEKTKAIAAKTKALAEKAKDIEPNTFAACDFIRQCLLSYSKANIGIPFLASAARFFSGAEHRKLVAQLLLKPDYSTFGEVFGADQLRNFLVELKGGIGQNKIDHDGDLHAILTIAKTLTSIDFYALEENEKDAKLNIDKIPLKLPGGFTKMLQVKVESMSKALPADPVKRAAFIQKTNELIDAAILPFAGKNVGDDMDPQTYAAVGTALAKYQEELVILSPGQKAFIAGMSFAGTIIGLVVGFAVGLAVGVAIGFGAGSVIPVFGNIAGAIAGGSITAIAAAVTASGLGATLGGAAGAALLGTGVGVAAAKVSQLGAFKFSGVNHVRDIADSVTQLIGTAKVKAPKAIEPPKSSSSNSSMAV